MLPSRMHSLLRGLTEHAALGAHASGCLHTELYAMTCPVKEAALSLTYVIKYYAFCNCGRTSGLICAMYTMSHLHAPATGRLVVARRKSDINMQSECRDSFSYGKRTNTQGKMITLAAPLHAHKTSVSAKGAEQQGRAHEPAAEDGGGAKRVPQPDTAHAQFQRSITRALEHVLHSFCNCHTTRAAVLLQYSTNAVSGSQARKAVRAGVEQSACTPVAALAACEDDAERQQHLKRKEEATDAPKPRSHGALGASGAHSRPLTFTAVAESCLRRSEAPTEANRPCAVCSEQST